MKGERHDLVRPEPARAEAHARSGRREGTSCSPATCRARPAQAGSRPAGRRAPPWRRPTATKWRRAPPASCRSWHHRIHYARAGVRLRPTTWSSRYHPRPRAMTGGSQGLWSFPRRRPWRAIASRRRRLRAGRLCLRRRPAGRARLRVDRDRAYPGFDAGPRGRKRPRHCRLRDRRAGGGVPASANYWTLNLSTGAVQDYGAESPPLPSSSSTPPPPSPYTCTAGVGGAGSDVHAPDRRQQHRRETDVANVLSYAQCPGADGTLTAFTVDASGNTVLSTGPFTQLAAGAARLAGERRRLVELRSRHERSPRR